MKKRKIVLALMMMLIGLGFSGFVFDSTSASAASYTASISTSGNINLDVSSAGNGANITTDNVGIVSTCPYGYNVSIAAKSVTNTSFSDTTLYKDGDKTNTADTKKINTSTGTIASPVSILGNNNKTWGYTTQTINSGSAVTINSNFVGLTTTQTNLTTSASGTSATGTTLPVYYGVSVDNTIEPGLYKMSDDAVITYYLTTSLDCTSYQVAFNPTSTAGGQTLSGTGTMDNQRISEGVATALTANTFTAPSGYEFKEWNTAQDGTGTSYTNSQSVTDLTSVGGTITLYAQWQRSCVNNRICYFENGSNVEGTMGNQTANANASVTLLASNFSRTGYGFAGWSPDENVTASSKIYGPQETITTPASMTGGMKLYAVWVQSQGSLQDSSKVASVCSSLTKAPTDGTANLSSVSALTDSRDDNTYAIAKLADGNCWMIENLRLERTNSDNSTGNLAQGYGTSTTYGNFSGLADAESTGFTSTYTANSLYYSGTQEGTASIDIGTSNYPAYRMPRYNNTNTSARASSPTSNGGAMYSYGNYYTWHAAIADLTYNGTNNQSTTSTSLCPTGWHLPQGGDKTRIESNDDNDFWNLTVDALNGGTNPANYDSQTRPYYTGTAEAGPVADKLRSYPNNFLYSGYFTTSSALDRGSNGRYWSSTAYTNTTSYGLRLISSSVYPGTGYGNKYFGFSIRCVAYDPPAPANTVQYNPNGSDVEGTMGDQTITSSDTSLTLLASNFSRTGYGFVGWSEDKNVTNSSKIYGPQETITFAEGAYASAGLKLYAVWVVSAGSLQDTTKVAELCGTGENALIAAPTDGTANLKSVSALTDSRDNSTYAIAKLADGNCWMIENLRLESTNSDNSTGNLAQGYGTSTTYGNFSGLADAESANFSNSTTANSLYYSGTQSGTASINIGTSNDPAYRMPRYNNWNNQSTSANRPQNPTTNDATNSTTNAGMYSYGNYYTWAAAIADTTHYSSGDHNITSICPTGWQLPLGNTSTGNIEQGATDAANKVGGFSYLDRKMGGTGGASADSLRWRKFPVNFVYSGSVDGDLAYYRGSFGRFWSSTASSSSDAYILTLFPSIVNTGTTSNDKYIGYTVRCVAPGA